ncbi:BQ5605_C003g02065 [Microbotryum silenes-dioicae]|uniref:BQ5605_C003g02065 protein n=1 Tax=Microbotryum silenes-dioicae TaxID=796604 RepID=A0A2X0M0Q4_9BASI|nr:BQ5605_C003g02065 [Microbotryum silenes-dioicae]
MVLCILVSIALNSESSAEEVKSRLVEFAQSYRSDQGTLDWHVMQNPKIYVQDKTKFAIVERYTDGKAIKTHTANPLYAKFGKWIAPLVASPPVITVYTELESAKL